jgi:hypothetical protein
VDFLVVDAVLQNQSPVGEFPVFGLDQGIFLSPQRAASLSDRKNRLILNGLMMP